MRRDLREGNLWSDSAWHIKTQSLRWASLKTVPWPEGDIRSTKVDIRAPARASSLCVCIRDDRRRHWLQFLEEPKLLVIHGPWQQSLFQTPRFVFSSVWIFNEIQERAPSMQIGVHSRSSAISSSQWCKLCITKGIVAAKRSARACFHSGKKRCRWGVSGG